MRACEGVVDNLPLPFCDVFFLHGDDRVNIRPSASGMESIMATDPTVQTSFKYARPWAGCMQVC